MKNAQNWQSEPTSNPMYQEQSQHELNDSNSDIPDEISLDDASISDDGYDIDMTYVPVRPQCSYEFILFWSMLSISTIVGCYLRIAFMYYKPFPTNGVNYSILWVNILGSVLFGFFNHHKLALSEFSPSLLHRYLYVSLTTGFCGSLTSFSFWQFESQKNFFLQFDTSPLPNLRASYNGAQFCEWLVSLWIGVGMPLLALQFGQFLATFSPLSNSRILFLIAESASLTHHQSHHTQPTLKKSGEAIDEEEQEEEDGVELKQQQKQQKEGERMKINSSMPHHSSQSHRPTHDIQQQEQQHQHQQLHQQKKEEEILRVVQSQLKKYGIWVPRTEEEREWPEVASMASYFLIMVLLLILPTAVFPTYGFLTTAAVCGCVGSYLRHVLESVYNPHPYFAKILPNFGSFLSHLFGCFFLACMYSFAKFSTEYHDTPAQTMVFGLVVGFSGCLSGGMSTFVHEILSLPQRTSYHYALVTVFASQLIILTFHSSVANGNIPHLDLITKPAISTFPLCHTYSEMCNYALDTFNCSLSQRKVFSCVHEFNPATFQGVCQCGSYTPLTTRISELLVDSQVKGRLQNGGLMQVWPTHAVTVEDPYQVVDTCLTFESSCSLFLDRIQCPYQERLNSGCNRQGVTETQGLCQCGLFRIASSRIQELIMDVSLSRRYDLLSYQGYPTLVKLPMCEAYDHLCMNWLDDIQCPITMRHSLACDTFGDIRTYRGICSCGKGYKIANTHLSELLLQNLMQPTYNSLISTKTIYSGNVNKENIVIANACSSYLQICTSMLNKLGCPTSLRNVSACTKNSGGQSFGIVSQYIGTCGCGPSFVTIPSQAVSNMVVDGILALRLVAPIGSPRVYTAKSISSRTLSTSSYTYIPPPRSPYEIVVNTDPFSPLLAHNDTPSYAYFV